MISTSTTSLKTVFAQSYVLYVDDLLILRLNLQVINDMKSMLSANFDVHDLGEVSIILRIKITRPKKGISLDQS